MQVLCASFPLAMLTWHFRLDTAGTEQFTAMRELYMKQGQGFLLVFSICNWYATFLHPPAAVANLCRNSFYELSELREQIIRIKDDDDVPLVIVGNKSDMEEDRVVPRARAFQLAQQWGSKPYYETSARRRVNVDEAFVNLCRQIIQKDTNRYQTLTQQAPVHRERHYRDRGGRPRHRSRKRDKCVIL